MVRIVSKGTRSIQRWHRQQRTNYERRSLATKLRLGRKDFVGKGITWADIVARVAARIGPEEGSFLWWYDIVEVQGEEETRIGQEKAFTETALTVCQKAYKGVRGRNRIVRVWRHDMEIED